MRLGLQLLSLSTILFGAYGIALNDAHPQSARDNTTTPLILEKSEGEHRVRRARDGWDGGSLAEGYADLKRRLSMPRALIFDSSVDDGTPSLPAAPNGPATRPLLSMKAASMASFSLVASVPPASGAGAA